MGNSGDNTNNTCCTTVTLPTLPTALLQYLVTIAENMKSAIEKFYPPAASLAQYVAELNFTVRADISLVVRLRWVDVYGKETVISETGEVTIIRRKFDKTSQIHLLQIKDIYLSFGDG